MLVTMLTLCNADISTAMNSYSSSINSCFQNMLYCRKTCKYSLEIWNEVPCYRNFLFRARLNFQHIIIIIIIIIIIQFSFIIVLAEQCKSQLQISSKYNTNYTYKHKRHKYQRKTGFMTNLIS